MTWHDYVTPVDMFFYAHYNLYYAHFQFQTNIFPKKGGGGSDLRKKWVLITETQKPEAACVFIT